MERAVAELKVAAADVRETKGQLAVLKRELEEALAAGRATQGLKEECAALKQELKLMKDER